MRRDYNKIEMNTGQNTKAVKNDRRIKLASLRESLKAMPVMKKMGQSLEERIESHKRSNVINKNTSLSAAP